MTRRKQTQSVKQKLPNLMHRGQVSIIEQNSIRNKTSAISTKSKNVRTRNGESVMNGFKDSAILFEKSMD